VPESRTTGGAATLPRLITVNQAAQMLAVSSETVRSWIDKGSIPHIVLPQSGTRREFRIPLQGLLSCLSGNYDLAAELESLNEAARRIDPDVDVLDEMSRRPRS
jgi:excisionase family DNA binding protein